MDRKKELKEQYMNTKLSMGVIVIKCKKNGKLFLRSASNLTGIMNSIRFQLKTGAFKSEELQREWNEYGPEEFEIEILDTLDHDKDGSKTNYSEDLELLMTEWHEKLSSEGAVFYRK